MFTYGSTRIVPGVEVCSCNSYVLGLSHTWFSASVLGLRDLYLTREEEAQQYSELQHVAVSRYETVLGTTVE